MVYSDTVKGAMNHPGTVECFTSREQIDKELKVTPRGNSSAPPFLSLLLRL